jgi:hypothetical protein
VELLNVDHNEAPRIGAPGRLVRHLRQVRFPMQPGYGHRVEMLVREACASAVAASGFNIIFCPGAVGDYLRLCRAHRAAGQACPQDARACWGEADGAYEALGRRGR